MTVVQQGLVGARYTTCSMWRLIHLYYHMCGARCFSVPTKWK